MTTSSADQEIRDFLEHRDPAEQRFGVTMTDIDVAASRVMMDMPFGSLRHPDSDAPCLGLLTMLIDAAGGSVNYAHFRGDRWSVTSELSLDLGTAAATTFSKGSAGVIRCDARTLNADGATAIALCTLTVDGVEIGVGTVRSYTTPTRSRVPEWLPDPAGGVDQHDLLAMLALSVGHSDADATAFVAGADPTLHNSMGVMHGGVVSTAMEVVAVAALSRESAGTPMGTGSIRVNYLRPMFTGADARYEGEIVRSGRTTAIADARAINADGKVAATARITGYAVPNT